MGGWVRGEGRREEGGRERRKNTINVDLGGRGGASIYIYIYIYDMYTCPVVLEGRHG